MGQTCSRCSRVNPVEAAYCYFDGAILGGNGANAGPVNIGSQAFPNQFHFPTGQVCRNFDQLAVTCQQNWKAALDVLQQGYLETFLGGLGRSDLAAAARDAARFPDHDRGLDQFLAKIPSDAIKPPKLIVEPTEINLGQLKAGEDRKIELHLRNQGMRLVFGTVRCDGLWLAVGEGAGASQKLFQFGTTLVIPVHIRGKNLQASNRPLQGKLVIETNAPNAPKIEVIVKGELPVKPYPDGIFAGAKSPRQVAEKAKAAPRDASPLFENGAVAKWYKDNGWTYPVHGPAASGLGAVQQFFEALGLTPAPKVEISDKAISLRGDAGGQARHTIEVKAQEKRPVYAYAVSDQPWLEVSKARLNGRVASIPISVGKIPNNAGQTLKANLTVKANGNQKFVVPVTLEIGGAGRGGGVFDFGAPAAAAAAAVAIPAAIPMPQARAASPRANDTAPIVFARPAATGGGLSLAHLLPAALLFLALLIVFVIDLFSTRQTGPLKDDVDVVGDPLKPPIYNADPHIGISWWEFNQRFGIKLLKERDPIIKEEFKRLTYGQNGENNNICIKLDGQENLYGQTPGTWSRKAKEEIPRRKWSSTWKFRENVYVTQIVMIVPNADTLNLDTVLIYYLVENRDATPHRVGLRIMLDTYIGAEDGTPFLIPGQSELLTTKKDISNFKDIPDFIQAIEYPDPKNPGTTATLVLKLPTDIKFNRTDPDLEPVKRLVICRWPGNPEVRWDFVAKGMFWDMNDKARGEKNDSCVVVYWEERDMGPGDRRAMAISYGLGKLFGIDKKNKELALSYNPKPSPGTSYTVVGWVTEPKPGQSVRLNLPSGMSFDGSEPDQTVSRSEKGMGQVSWKVKVSEDTAPGKYPLTAETKGAQATLKVSVSKKGRSFDLFIQ